MTTITPYLAVKGAAEAIDFYQRAFGAVEHYRIPMEDGRIGHADLSIGEAKFMLSDEFPDLNVYAPGPQGPACSFSLNVEDPDALYDRAVAAGATVDRPMKDEPYGRSGWINDPFGHRWNITRANPDFDPASMGAP